MVTDFDDSGWIPRKTGNKYDRSDIQPLFLDLQEKAEEEHGHEGGHSGYINSVGDFMMCGVMTRKQFETGMRWSNNMNEPSPKILRDLGVGDKWEKAIDPNYNDACAVVIKDETRDTTVISGGFIEDKGVIPANNREKKKYVVNYESNGWTSEHRVSSVPDAWEFIKGILGKNPDAKIESIENSYTYAKPKISRRTKKAKEVRVEFFGTAPN